MKPPAIAIRPYELTDIESCYQAVIESKESLGRWMPWCHPGYSMDDSRTWVESQVKAFPAKTECAFVIVDRENHMLGGCGLNHFDQENLGANLGYWVRSSCLRRGIANF
jgi:RimJ/RimL family protein N-acetyltransferase